MSSPAPAELAARDDEASSRSAPKPKLLGLALAVAVAVLTVMLPAPQGLSPAAKNLVGIFCLTMILWVTEAIPVAATALLVVVLQPLLQVTTVGAAVSGFMSPVFLFVIAMFCIAQVVVDSGLTRRFALALLERARGDAVEWCWPSWLGLRPCDSADSARTSGTCVVEVELGEVCDAPNTRCPAGAECMAGSVSQPRAAASPLCADSEAVAVVRYAAPLPMKRLEARSLR